MDKWEKLKEKLEKWEKSYEKGVCMSMGESMWGASIIGQALDLMKKIEGEEKC